MEQKIDQYEEHEGPVRGIHFHHTQPIFVSGGDDYKIKVWNYQQRRCLFNLLGHLDYIRTVYFHHEQPWILSSSDDQTIRIWNWQSRTCLSVLTGHNHYVMCAQWHPKEDLIISASLDQTARIWDFSGLKKKHASKSTGASSASADLFGAAEVVVKHVLEGHSRGLNWAAFHKTNSVAVTGADDREVKLWRWNESRAWEVDTFRGHTTNVSCVMFHPRRELIITNSEDKTIRVWDMSKANVPSVFRRDNDRFWIFDAHPTLNILAAGHDSGFLIFKLNRERPAYDAQKQSLFYMRDQYIMERQYATGNDHTVMSTRSRARTAAAPRSLHYNDSNKTHHCILLHTDSDSSYELFVFPKAESKPTEPEADTSMRGVTAKAVTFVSRNRFAVLDSKQKTVSLRTLRNETKKTLTIPVSTIHNIFYGGIGRILLRTNEGVALYDIQAMRIINELATPGRFNVKYAVWSPDGKYVALLSKTSIWIANSNLEELCTITEPTRVKSGAWDAATNVFIYATSVHIKYFIPNGDSGLLKSLENQMYITAVTASNTIHYIDKESKCGSVSFEATEYLFKLALWKKKHKEVMRLIQSKRLAGQAIVSYLQKQGYPEVALHLADDDKLRFNLALDCGNIKVAMECATKLDDPECWHKLGVAALRQGNHQVVEAAYQKTKNFERLSFLYLITGNTDKLSKMLHIATLRGDLMGRFHNALFLGDVKERVKVFKDAGQLGLAYVCAKNHGLEEEVAELTEALGDRIPAMPATDPKLFLPPIPIFKEANWPLLEVGGTFWDLEEVKEEELKESDEDRERELADEDDALGWGDADIPAPASEAPGLSLEGGGWGVDLDIPVDLGVSDSAADERDETKGDDASGDYFVMPISGKSAVQKWAANATLAADLVAAGSFDLAMSLLNRQIGAVNFEPLQPHFLAIYNSAQCLLPLLPGSEPLSSPLLRVPGEEKSDCAPDLCLKFSQCDDLVKEGYKAVTDGAFARGQACFTQILHTLPLVVVDNKAQAQEAEALVGICREYVTAMRLELARKELTADPNRQAELSGYFTRCQLQTTHAILALRLALKCMYTVKNYKTTTGICRRLLDLCVTSKNPAVEKLVNRKQITDLLRMCEKTNTDAVSMQYDEDATFVLCCASFTPILKGQPSSLCPYCGSHYKPEFEGEVCRTCNLSRIGMEASGLRVL